MSLHSVRKILLPALVAVASAVSLAAHAATLDFSGNICGAAGNAGCGNGSQIGQNYGDVAGQLDISHRSAVSSTGVTYEAFLKHWSTEYSNLTSVAWGGANASQYFSEFTFTPLAGMQVTLVGFDFGDYQDRDFGSSVAIYDTSNNVLWNGGSFDPGVTATHFAPNITRATPLVLRWGPDGYDVGIDNIAFTVSAVAAIPEPSTYALMLAGLGFVGFVARRRRSLQFAA